VRLCLVTDRRRTAFRGGLDEQAAAAVDAGIDLIQIRERDLEAKALAALVTRIVARARGSATRVVVNDRVDVALACAADGVHLRADSLPISAVRAIVPRGFLIGRSVHTPDEARAAAGADYLIAGTVFPSESKPGAPYFGAAGLREIVRASTAPVLAIGGMMIDRVPDVAATGAAGIAAIGLFAGQQLAENVAEARRLFDSVRSHP
jgi:thiamine-phosphate pyrophosphorylase